MSQVGLPNRFHRQEGVRNHSERLVVFALAHVVPELEGAVAAAFVHGEVRRYADLEAVRRAASRIEEESPDLVAAAGDDALVRAVVRGLVRDGAGRLPGGAMCVLPSPIGDVARSLEVPAVLREALWVAATGISLPADVGVVALGDRSVAFPGALLLGIPTPPRQRWLGGEPFRVSLEWPDGRWSGATGGVILANAPVVDGRRLGQGMHDEQLDLIVLRPGGRRRAALAVAGWLSPLARIRVPHVSLEAEGPLGLALGGADVDLAWSGRAEARVHSRALHVRGGWRKSPL